MTGTTTTHIALTTLLTSFPRLIPPPDTPLTTKTTPPCTTGAIQNNHPPKVTLPDQHNDHRAVGAKPSETLTCPPEAQPHHVVVEQFQTQQGHNETEHDATPDETMKRNDTQQGTRNA